MAIVTNYKCDICKELVRADDDVCLLHLMQATIRTKLVKVDKDKHFCCPACFINYISELISNGNGQK